MTSYQFIQRFKSQSKFPHAFSKIRNDSINVAGTGPDLIEALNSELDFLKKRSTDVIETLIELINSKLENGEDLHMSCFG